MIESARRTQPQRQAARCAAVWLLTLGLGGCDKQPEGAAELPERLRGSWGQTDAHVHIETVGLEIDATTLKLGELTLTIKAGKAMGVDDYQVDEAEVSWTKAGKPPKPCKGTLSRQGNTLMVKLYKQGTEDRCEAVLDGDWNAWNVLTEIPESHRGTFGGDARSADADVGLRIAADGIGFTDSDDRVIVSSLVQPAATPDTLYVRSSKRGDAGCVGRIVKDGEKLRLDLTPTGDAATAECPHGSGIRWTVDAKHLPTGTFDNGHVTMTVKDGRAILSDKEGLRCEQEILRTSERSVTGSHDGIPVTGGVVMVLARATPVAGREICDRRLHNIAPTLCQERLGMPCEQTLIDEFVFDEIACPRQLIVGDAMTGGHKAALLPATTSMLACWDVTGVFAVK